MEKTFNILIEETKRNIVAVLNNANLPIYVINCILKDLYNETEVAYRNSYAQEQRDYDLFLQQEQNKSDDTVEEK